MPFCSITLVEIFLSSYLILFPITDLQVIVQIIFVLRYFMVLKFFLFRCVH